MRGSSTATGVWLLHREEDTNSYLCFVNHHCHWIYHWLHIAWRLAYYHLESFIINERHDYPIPEQIAFKEHLRKEDFANRRVSLGSCESAGSWLYTTSLVGVQYF